jgi:O-antigen ligase
MLEDRATKAFRAVMFVLMSFLLVQSAMTYSRGGLYAFAGAAAVTLVYTARDTSKLWRMVAVITVAGGLAYYAVIPALDELTDGSLTKRFQDVGLTGRDTLAASELELWRENPILGVGPGQLVSRRDVSLAMVGAHTEFSRLVAEHGLFGAGSLLLLLLISVRLLKGPSADGHKALALAGLAWGFLFMSNAGMRIVAPAFLVGFAAITQGLHATQPAQRRPKLFRHIRRSSSSAAGR